MGKADESILGDDVDDNSHHIWTAGERRRIGVDVDQKSEVGDAKRLLVSGTGDVGDMILKTTFFYRKGEASRSISTARSGRSSGQVSLGGPADGSIHCKADRMEEI